MIEIATARVEGTSVRVSGQNIPFGLIGGYITIDYVDSVWNGLVKTVVFRGSQTIDVVTQDTRVKIPVEVLQKKGKRIYVGFYGTDRYGEEAIPTIWGEIGTVVEAADPSGDESTDPTLPMWAQLAGEFKELKDSGFVGPPGPQGEPGPAGSPGIPGRDGTSATHSWNGTILTVTSASGTSSADLKGERGEQGPAGERGPAGDRGDPGPPGPAGADGTITFEDLTPEQKESLRGEPGKDGVDGKDGYTPQKGIDYFDGQPGKDGVAGKDGSPGEPGRDGVDGISATHSWNGTVLTISSASGTSSADLRGERGEQGPAGEKGDTGSVAKSKITVTLNSRFWSSLSQTVTASGVTTSNDVIVTPDPASLELYGECGVYCSAQASNKLTFKCKEKPGSNLTVNVMILG